MRVTKVRVVGNAQADALGGLVPRAAAIQLTKGRLNFQSRRGLTVDKAGDQHRPLH